MQRLDLAEMILDYIKQLYKAEYVGLLEVHQDNDMYTLHIGMPSYMMQTTISYQTDSDSKFLNFVKEELRTRNYMRLDIYKVNRKNDSKEE